MNKEKWKEIAGKIIEKSFIKTANVKYCAKNWPQFRKRYVDWLREMDELTEVFNMENKGGE